VLVAGAAKILSSAHCQCRHNLSMRRLVRLGTLLLGGALFFTGCAWFDSGVPWRDGQYKLLWIDLPDEVELVYDMGGGGSVPLVEARVFAVGTDDRYVVAKQHPAGRPSSSGSIPQLHS
jgi:hypothetical protein